MASILRQVEAKADAQITKLQWIWGFENRSAPEGRKNKNFHVSPSYYSTGYFQNQLFTLFTFLYVLRQEKIILKFVQKMHQSQRGDCYFWTLFTLTWLGKFQAKASTFKRKVLRPVGGGSGVVASKNKVFNVESIKSATWVSGCIFITVRNISFEINKWGFFLDISKIA